MAATPHPPENKNPVVTSKMASPAGTRTGLNNTMSGVAMTRAKTVPVKVNPDKKSNIAPSVVAVKNLAVWRGDGAELLSFRVMVSRLFRSFDNMNGSDCLLISFHIPNGPPLLVAYITLTLHVIVDLRQCSDRYHVALVRI
ncbi:hypothetical protein PVK06_022277 [Gossypium arboreum]|uniref:Uncharacterized protein n=1 Tax=Gossypium arboreum TaxID=29729 RepID=A0ABR0P801_GOSAR|nr:hypothetical protein PVK06_022277 [Gossypium arboreum]